MTRSRPVFIVLFYMLISLGLSAQIMNEDYEKVNTITRDSRNKGNLSFSFLWSEKHEVLIIGFGFKPSKFEVYDTKTWARMSFFETKGHISEDESFFSPVEDNVVYIKKSRGKSLFKVNFSSGEVLETTTYNQLKFEVPIAEYNNQFYELFWRQKIQGVNQYLFFENYALNIKDIEIDVFKRD
ncbi:hypothetical protein [Roseivirga sp. E12]|uniref:hypothetical protein n=1 Tax=Roseivirga sp. E12 TaxID=2819237 RepID=UPI001ABC1680|nr:hypothetical protein [Roseivirga sp. E12]MBO3697525.1 hypothetical protein [Roseivirga sp. E12]